MASVEESEAISISHDFWQQFDLDGRRSGLDAQGMELQEAHRRSTAARKHLQEETKGFKGKSRDEQLSSLGSLMKLYQKEVDSLTRRSRAADAAFFGLYKALFEAPDPAPALLAAKKMLASDGASAASRASEAGAFSSTSAGGGEEELRALRREVQEYQEEIALLKNQDVTVRKLEAQVQEWEREVDRRVSAALAERREESNAEFNQRVLEMQRGQESAQAQVSLLEKQLQQSKAARERAEQSAFAVEQRAEESVAAVQREQQMLQETCDSLNERLFTLQSERDALRAKVSGARPSAAAAADLGDAGAKESEAALAELSAQLSLSRRDAADQRLACEGLRRRAGELKAAHEASEAAAREELAALRAQLELRPTEAQFSEVKRELKVLQMLEYNVEEDAQGDEKNAFGAAGTAERILLRRARKLESEVVTLKRGAEASQAEIRRLSDSLSAAKQTLSEESLMVKKLEDHLAIANASPAAPPPAPAPGAPPAGAAPPPASGSEELLTQILEGASAAEERTARAEAPPADGPEATSALRIVAAQRDRFRGRIADLEKELLAANGRGEADRKREKRLKADNVALYEKIRFLQHQLGAGGGDLEAGGAEAGAGPEGAMRRRELARYHSIYEASRDPFASFTQAEKRRKLTELSPAERVTLQASRIFLASKKMRTFAFFYVVGLHALIFLTAYYATHFCSSGGLVHPQMLSPGSQLPHGVDWDSHPSTGGAAASGA